MQQWDEALQLAESNPGLFDTNVFLPFAEWLTEHDRFDEALRAYQKAGRADLSFKMIEQLTYNAIVENRFKDASYYYWLQAEYTLGLLKNPYNGLLPYHNFDISKCLYNDVFA